MGHLRFIPEKGSQHAQEAFTGQDKNADDNAGPEATVDALPEFDGAEEYYLGVCGCVKSGSKLHSRSRKRRQEIKNGDLH